MDILYMVNDDGEDIYVVRDFDKDIEWYDAQSLILILARGHGLDYGVREIDKVFLSESEREDFRYLWSDTGSPVDIARAFDVLFSIASPALA